MTKKYSSNMRKKSARELFIFYLAVGPCDFVDDVGKDHILVVCVAAHLFPLRILTQANVISKEGVADTERGVSSGLEALYKISNDKDHHKDKTVTKAMTKTVRKTATKTVTKTKLVGANAGWLVSWWKVGDLMIG